MVIEFDAAEAEALLVEYPERVERTVVRALNRGINSGRTLAVQTLARDMRLRSAFVRDRIAVRLATSQRPTAGLSPSRRPISPIQFGARERRGQGVTFTLPGQGKVTLPHAFIATMPSGRVGVFERVRPTLSRKGKPRSSPALKIKQVSGPSIADIFKLHRPAIIARALEMFRTNLLSGLRFAMRDDG